MLQTIRDRAQGIFAWIILILIIVPFALWGIQNYFSTGREKPIAVVGEREFFERDLLRLYEQQYARFAEQYDEAELKRQALERLIDDELLFQTALTKHLTISDEQVARFLRSLSVFQTDGQFDEEKYHRLLDTQGLTTAAFVDQVRRSLLLEQLRRAVIDSAFASDTESRRFHTLQNQLRKIAYLILPLPQEDIEVRETEIRAYYDEHQDLFRTPEKIAVEYLTLSIDAIARTIQPDEEVLRQYYEEQKQAFTTPEQRRVRHILVAVGPDAGEEEKRQALNKAKAIRQRLLNGEDFAKLARELSDDPGSKAQGGDLGLIRKGLMEKDFEEAAFALAEDEISEPVETPFGYHLIQVTEIKPAQTQPFEAVKGQILRTVQRQEAEDRFYQLGEQLAQLAYENPQSLEPAAEALGLKIQTSEPFSRDRGTGIAANAKIRATAFSPDVLEGNNSTPVELEDGSVVVLRVKEHFPSKQRPLAEVRDAIVAELRQRKARQRLEQQTQTWLRQLQQGGRLEDLADRLELTVQTVELTRTTSPPELGEIVGAIFQADKPQDRPTLLSASLSDGRQVLVAILQVREGDYAKLSDGEKKTLKANLARLFGLMSFKEYQQQLRDQTRIKVNWPPEE